MRQTMFCLTLGCALWMGCRENTTSKIASPVPVNLAAEIARAGTENKLLVLQFTGSDWCPGCIAFEKEVLSQPEFISYAQSNLVWVGIDLPEKTKLPAAVEATNHLLTTQFDVAAFPTFIALDPAGKELWRLPAKDDPHPTLDPRIRPFIDQLEAVRKKSK